MFRPLDLSDVAAIPTFVQELRREFGPIYGLVNNAGLGTAGLLENVPDTEIDALVRINTLSPILLSKCVVRGMIAEGHGRVINVCSIRVRREKAALSSGCEPHPANAPAGSNRSSHGGDEMAEAFGVAGHI